MKIVLLAVGIILTCTACSTTKIKTESSYARPGGKLGKVETPTEKKAHEHFKRGFERRRKGDLDGAIKEYRKAYEALQPSDPPHAWGAVLNEYGLTLFAAQRYKEALSVIQSALERNTEAHDKVGMAISHLNLGDAHRRLGNDDSAQTHWKESLKIAEELGHKKILKAISARPIK